MHGSLCGVIQGQKVVVSICSFIEVTQPETFDATWDCSLCSFCSVFTNANFDDSTIAIEFRGEAARRHRCIDVVTRVTGVAYFILAKLIRTNRNNRNRVI